MDAVAERDLPALAVERDARPASFSVFGIKITPMTLDVLLTTLAAFVASRRPCVIASQNMHGISVMLHDDDFRRLHEDGETLVHIDGMPLVALCRLAGLPVGREHRVTLVDLVWPLLSLAEASGWRVFYLGSTRRVLDRALDVVRRRHPGLPVAAHHGFFDLTDRRANDAVVAEIRSFAPQLLLVGMGMGRQERWIAEHRAAVGDAVILTVGACMEYVAGEVGTPPRWMGGSGLEWVYRLTESPARFWRRYLVEPWPVFLYLLRSMARRP